MVQPTVREARVAGSFYPGGRRELQIMLDEFFEGALPAGVVPGPALGAVVPHAGYVYSGRVAAKVFAQIQLPDSVVVIAPNHTGRGARFSLWKGGAWRTPLGDAPVDEDLVSSLLEECRVLEADTLAHRDEHAVEVQVPFLQRARPEVRLVAIVVATQDASRLKALGDGIASAIGKSGRDCLVVASSDMNHYEEHRLTLEKDELALERLLALDPEGLLRVCDEKDISMCGVAPTAAMLYCALARGAKTATLIDHRTSGEVFGDYERVVGYAGVIVR